MTSPLSAASPQLCRRCGGTRLAYSVAGAERGTCSCPRGPGRIKARLMYGTAARPEGWREYAVEWQDSVIEVHPPTLSHAVEVLDGLRAELEATCVGGT